MAIGYKGAEMMNLDDVAYLFVEQYENIHGLYTEAYRKSEVDLIRRSVDKGESALYTVLTTISSTPS